MMWSWQRSFTGPLVALEEPDGDEIGLISILTRHLGYGFIGTGGTTMPLKVDIILQKALAFL